MAPCLAQRPFAGSTQMSVLRQSRECLGTWMSQRNRGGFAPRIRETSRSRTSDSSSPGECMDARTARPDGGSITRDTSSGTASDLGRLDEALRSVSELATVTWQRTTVRETSRSRASDSSSPGECMDARMARPDGGGITRDTSGPPRKGPTNSPRRAGSTGPSAFWAPQIFREFHQGGIAMNSA